MPTPTSRPADVAAPVLTGAARHARPQGERLPRLLRRAWGPLLPFLPGDHQLTLLLRVPVRETQRLERSELRPVIGVVRDHARHASGVGHLSNAGPGAAAQSTESSRKSRQSSSVNGLKMRRFVLIRIMLAFPRSMAVSVTTTLTGTFPKSSHPVPPAIRYRRLNRMRAELARPEVVPRGSCAIACLLNGPHHTVPLAEEWLHVSIPCLRTIQSGTRNGGDSRGGAEAQRMAHTKQVQTYLPLTGCKLGCLLNFGGDEMKAGITRCVTGLEQ